MTMEFQAVVMAAGRGSRMTDLTSRIPKPLLPVGNKPMIWYTVDMLEKAGFHDIIIVVLKSVLHDMKRALEEVHPVGVQLEYFPISDDIENDDFGTAETLRMLLHDRIKTDMFIVSCDLIVDENITKVIHELADMHRINEATVTMLLAPALEFPDGVIAVPGGRAQQRIERDIIGLDKSGQRVLFLAADSDVEQICFHLSQLRRFPFIQINSGLVDSHMYILKHSVFDFLKQNRSLSTVKGDLIPLLVKHQLSGKKHSKPESSTSVEDGILVDQWANELDLDMLVKEMSTMGDSNRRVSNTRNDRHDVICCALVLQQGLCLRANSLLSYCEANKKVAQLASSRRATGSRQSHADSLVGDGVKVGEKSTIKFSVVGDQSIIGDRTKIINCVIMDHVTIESGATLTGCVICSNANIGSGAELRDCLVGVKQSVAAGKHTNAMILEQDHMMI